MKRENPRSTAAGKNAANKPARRTILLNPGPVTLTERVRGTLCKEDLCHREPEFAELMLDIKRRLVRVYPEAAQDYEAVLMTGSGTCAVEAMLSSFVPRGGKVLVLANGVYGERMASMIEAQGKGLELVRSEWPEPMNVAEADRRLAADPGITHVLTVHNETTTGRLNDLPSLGRVLKKHNRRLLLDSVSSFAVEDIRFAEWNLDALCSVANKCIHGAPGICFVLARRDLLENGKSGATSLYLDLYKYYKDQKIGSSPYTQATHVSVAMQEALAELEEGGGQKARHERYLHLSRTIRAELNAMGISRFLPEDAYCSVISSFYLPEGVTYQELHDLLKQEGFVIYAGQAGLYSSVFRIANLGDITDADLDRLLGVFRKHFGRSAA
jgi:2-aminoethylphosphonate-pyruvate transaminase